MNEYGYDNYDDDDNDVYDDDNDDDNDDDDNDVYDVRISDYIDQTLFVGYISSFVLS